MVEGQLLPQPVFVLAQCADPSPYCRDMLTDGEIDAFHKRRIDLPATGSEHIMDGGQCAEDHTVAQPHEAPAPHGLDHLDFLPFVKARGEIFTSPCVLVVSS